MDSMPSSHDNGLPDYNIVRALQVLKDYHIVFVVDDSRPMDSDKWTEVGRSLAGVARTVAQYDNKGISIYFLSSMPYPKGHSMKSEDEVMKLFQSVEPCGPMAISAGDQLSRLMSTYIGHIANPRARGRHPLQPLNLNVITGGALNGDVTSAIRTAANQLEGYNLPLSLLGAQFFQIGNDSTATEALEKLDNELIEGHKIRDIVGTTKYEGKPLTQKTIIKVLLGSIIRCLHSQGGGAGTQK